MFGIGVPELMSIIIGATACYWVYHDAKARNSAHPVLWAFFVFWFCIVVLPLYLLFRPRKAENKLQNPANGENATISQSVSTDNSTKCSECSTVNKPGTVYCENCGRRLI